MIVQKDLVILVADKNMEFTMNGLLSRTRSLGIRQITYDCFQHLERDPGCLLRGHDFLRPLINRYKHALVVFDYDGCGNKRTSSDNLAVEVENRLSLAGWGDRSAAIVIDPELDVWIWSRSPNVDLVLGWEQREPDLRSWLVERGFIETEQVKPKYPKEALEQALKIVGKPRSSSLYYRISQLVSFDRCIDPAFLKLKTRLRTWFSE